MILFYRTYKHCVRATLLNFFMRYGSIFLAIIGISFFMEDKGSMSPLEIIASVLLIAAGVVILIIHNKVCDKLCEKVINKKLKTSASVAYDHVLAHPEAYDALCEANPKFAQKYTKDAEGKIVRR